MSKITIQTKETLFPVAENFYGLFFEDINRSGDSGLYPEMLRNRAFEDSILPARCTPLKGTYGFVTPTGWRDQFNNGEGLARWITQVPETPIPAWYATEASMELDREEVLNPNRLAALSISFKAGGAVKNIGFQGIPVEEGASYELLLFARGSAALEVCLESEAGLLYASKALTLEGDTYKPYRLTLTSCGTDNRAVFSIRSREPAQIKLGFTSLMPQDTYKGHGMRKDLMEMLENTHSKFLRFPGGCIVEGFTKETAARFSHMVGPVWERPSHNLMWHYRTTNGLGFHEYLQICEDLHLEPMYVVNCGLTCQGRKPEYFEGEELDDMLHEVFDAMEYATAPADTKWGKLRAQQGHPEPFHIRYLEIGNENDHEVYFTRYEKFYKAIHEKYPDLELISNSHTELEGLPTQIVDEHLYSTSDTFTTAAKIYETYDRKGPKIFIGEYAVTSGVHIGDLKSALAETMYLMDAEKNQDVVELTAYAPLFQNVSYTSWYPNLIAFDNHACYGIPFYHAVSMLAKSHGKEVLKSEITEKLGYPDPIGLNGVIAYQAGTFVKNVRVDGQPVKFSHGILGEVQEHGDGSLEIVSDYINELEGYPNMGHIPPHTGFVTFGEEEKEFCTYELEVLFSSPEQAVDITVWTHSTPMLFSRDETNPFFTSWNPAYTNRYVWTIRGGVGSFGISTRFNYTRFGSRAQLPIRYGEYNHIRIVTRKGGYDCYLNGTLAQKAEMVPYPVISQLVSADDSHIYVKIVNFGDEAETMEIALDSPVEPVYTAEVLTGAPKDTNSLEEPLKVAPVSRSYSNGGSRFTYEAEACSFHVLKLTKK